MGPGLKPLAVGPIGPPTPEISHSTDFDIVDDLISEVFFHTFRSDA